MAMAVGIDVSGGTAATTPANTYTVKAGGTNFFVIIPEGTHVYCKDGKFDPAKNVITVEYAAGSDLVASAGWVKVNDPTTVTADNGLVKGTSDEKGYQYQIVLKNDFTRTADGKSYDFSISKITLNATVWEPQTLFAANEATNSVVKYDIGYEVVDWNVTATTAGATANATATKINKVASITKDDGTQLESATLKVPGTTTIAGNPGIYAKANLNKGASIYVANDTVDFATTDAGYEASNVKAKIENAYNMAMTGVLEQTDVNAAKLYKVYAKGMDGKVASIAATLNNGVLTFSVPALSTVIVTTDTMTVTATTTSTETGTTTNPGTGANDIVGVAAALAVVALVSGAAISLKK